MDDKDKSIMNKYFGRECDRERIRTNILFTFPYGPILVPDLGIGSNFFWCVARLSGEGFDISKEPSDDDVNAFVVPIFVRSSDRDLRDMCRNWEKIDDGDFVTTRSGVVVLETCRTSPWEGYRIPEPRDYNQDRRMLKKSVKELAYLVHGYDRIAGDLYCSKYHK